MTCARRPRSACSPTTPGPTTKKIKEADAVVLGSPLYFGTVNAAMVSFVERFFGFCHANFTIAGKPFVLVVGGAGREQEDAAARLRQL